MNVKDKINFVLLLILSLTLSSCSGYSRKFKSKPAEGIFNMPMHKVDDLIIAEMIEEVIENQDIIEKYNKVKDKNIWINKADK